MKVPNAKDALDAINCFGPPREPTYRDTLNDAAPDLLRACRVALTFVQDGELPVDTPQSVASILLAAIKKAEGRQF